MAVVEGNKCAMVSSVTRVVTIALTTMAVAMAVTVEVYFSCGCSNAKSNGGSCNMEAGCSYVPGWLGVATVKHPNSSTLDYD